MGGLKNPEGTDKTWQKAAIKAMSRQLFDDDKQIYGYRRLSNELGKADIKSGRYQLWLGWA